MGLVQKIASKGLLYSFGIVFNRIVPEWLFRCRRYVIFEMKPGGDIAVNPKYADDGLQLRWCESEPDYRTVERVTYFQRDNQPFESEACLAAFEDKIVAGFWCAMNDFVETELGVTYKLQDDQTWLFAAQVDNDFQGRGIHQRVLQFMIAGLNDRGYPKVLLAVNPNNKPSIFAHQKHATRELGKILAIRFLKTTLCFTGNHISSNKMLASNSREAPIEIVINA